MPAAAAGGAILVAAGMAFEARLARGAGVAATLSGGTTLADDLVRALHPGIVGIASFGLCGGLDPVLPPGTLVVASRVQDAAGGGRAWIPDPDWSRRLLAALPQARHLPLAGSDRPLATAAAKARLRAETGAAAVDMESHRVARVAARHGLPFIVLRAVADPALRCLPRAALAGRREDGSLAPAAVLGALLRHTGELPALLRVAADAAAARRALARGRARLDRPGFCCPHLAAAAGRGLLELGQAGGDMA